MPKAAQQQSGRDEQQERDCDLSYDEQAFQLHPSVACGGSPAFVAQGLIHIGARKLERGKDSEHHAGQHRNSQGKNKDTPIHDYGDALRKIISGKRSQ